MDIGEYDDFKKRAETTGKYKVVTIDVVSCRDIRADYSKVNEYVKKVYRILEKESITHYNTKFNLEKGFLAIGDLFTFTVLADADDEYIKEILIREKVNNNIEYLFHFNTCKYETDNWVEGSTLYFMEYAVIWSDEHAKNNGIII